MVRKVDISFGRSFSSRRAASSQRPAARSSAWRRWWPPAMIAGAVCSRWAGRHGSGAARGRRAAAARCAASIARPPGERASRSAASSLRFHNFRVQSLFEPNTANRPRKPYKPLLASNGQRRHTNVRMHMQTPTPHADTSDHASPSSPFRASLDPRGVSSPGHFRLGRAGCSGTSGGITARGEESKLTASCRARLQACQALVLPLSSRCLLSRSANCAAKAPSCRALRCASPSSSIKRLGRC